MRTREAAYGVIVRDGRLLLAHWIDGRDGAWTLPGGGIEAGETSAAAAVREIREETGYVATVDRLLGVDTVVVQVPGRDPEGPTHPLRSVRHVYRATIVGGELTDEVDGSTDEARWFRLDAVPGLVRVPLVDVALRLWRSAGTTRSTDRGD